MMEAIIINVENKVYYFHAKVEFLVGNVRENFRDINTGFCVFVPNIIEKFSPTFKVPITFLCKSSEGSHLDKNVGCINGSTLSSPGSASGNANVLR